VARLTGQQDAQIAQRPFQGGADFQLAHLLRPNVKADLIVLPAHRLPAARQARDGDLFSCLLGVVYKGTQQMGEFHGQHELGGRARP
jgi:hypothetical protein